MTMPKATDRQYMTFPGEYYDDALTVEAALKNRSKPFEASCLLCARLQERKPKRDEMVQYLADKRSISFKEMWNLILSGKYKPLTGEELSKLQEIDPESEEQ
jgi:hypothetical protein